MEPVSCDTCFHFRVCIAAWKPHDNPGCFSGVNQDWIKKRWTLDASVCDAYISNEDIYRPKPNPN